MKKILALLLGMALLCGASGQAGERFRIGFAFYNLSNPVWAEVVSEAARYGAEKGMEVTYVDAGQDSARQIAQIENFIQAGMDAICVLAIDVAAVEPIAKQAMDKGIYLIDYSRGMENCHATLTLNPIATGEALAQMAAKWIEEKYGKNPTFKWGFLDIPTVEIGVQEGNATEAEMKKLFPNANLVANASTLTVEEGMKNTDAILQANPDLRVILSLSAGGGVGGNESIKTAISPSQYEDYALFSIDATEEEVLNILRGDPQKGSISLGSGGMHGRQLIEYADDLRNGKNLPKMNYLPIIPVTKKNAQEFYDQIFKK
ncbi:MAG: sugar ABC transporter substrate-binding protein [Planctomycetes bacterium]|nr:sugar ABC transporter substrate-binding protein [Planctomycetota bacterium]